MTLQQRVALDALVRHPQPDEPQTVRQMRDDFAALMATMRVPDGIRTSPTELAGRPALRVEPDAGTRPGAILYFHGGSNIVGSPATALCLTANLVVRTGLTALSLDYRLAPEHPFPAGHDDALGAYRALLDDGADPAGIVLAGDFAGGALAIVTALRALRVGLPTPAAIVTFSAGLDYTRSGASMTTKDGIDPFFTAAGLRRSDPVFLAGQDPRTEMLSPATLGDLAGLPPLLLQVGTNEVLLDDSTRLAARAVEAGVDVVLDVTADVPHVFQAFTGLLDEADQALDRAGLFVVQHLPVAEPRPA